MENMIKKTDTTNSLLVRIGIVFSEIFIAMLVIKFLGGLAGLLFISKSNAEPSIILPIIIYILYALCALFIPIIGLKKFPVTKNENAIKKDSRFWWNTILMLICTLIISLAEICVKCSNITNLNYVKNNVENNFIIITIISTIFAFILPLIYSYTTQKLVIDRVISHGEKRAILFSATMFFVVNFFGGTIQYWLLSSFILGLVLAYIYIKTSNIKYSMIINVIFNILFLPQIAIKIASIVNKLIALLF